MSNEVHALVQRRKLGSSTKKTVMVYLADRASDDGSGVWTSKTHIAADTELSKRSVQNAMAELEADGLISKTGKKPCARGFTYEYRVEIEAVARLEKTREDRGAGDSPVQEIHPKGCSTFTPRGAGDSPNTSLEPSLEPSSARETRDDLFSQQEIPEKEDPTLDELFARFWKAYPRKVGKRSARKAFENAITRAPAEIIIKRAERFAEKCAEAKTEEKFIKHPQGWLNDDRWDADDLREEAPRRSSYMDRARAIIGGQV